MSARWHPSPCRFHPAHLYLTSKPTPFSNQFNGDNELSTPTLSRSLCTATGLQNWRWKKLNPRVIPEQGLWNILECQKIPIHTMILVPMNRLKRRMQLLLCPICRSLLIRSLSSPGSCIASCARTQQAMILFYRLWGRDMIDEPRTAEPIGPHHLGKQGSIGRCPWWSRRLRDGIGKRDRPEPSIVSEATNGWALQLPKLQSSALQKSGATTGANHDGKTSKQIRKKKKEEKKETSRQDRKGKKQAWVHQLSASQAGPQCKLTHDTTPSWIHNIE